MQIVFHNTAGTAKVWRDDTLIHDATGLNTLGTTAGNVDIVDIRITPGLVVTTYNPAMDDVYVLNNSGTRNNARLGKDVRIKYYKPDADGSTNNFTKSSGGDAYYQHVNDIPEDDTKYLTSATTGHKQLFSMESVGTGQIAAVQSQSFVTPENPGTLASFRNIVKSGSATGNGQSRYEVHPTALEVFSVDIVEIDPNTSAGWAASGLNSAEFGVEVL
jgi:hypothetical protein